MDSAGLKTGRIFNIQKYSIYDGDGIRTLIFFKGCNIDCAWCSNPEGISHDHQVLFTADKCIHCGKCAEVCPTNVFYSVTTQEGLPHYQVDRGKKCIGCRRCEEICLVNALDIVGKEMTVAELMTVIMQDYDFYLSSGGGVTLGGGEVTLQADFAAELLTECKRRMINTAIETNGMTRLANYERLASCTDQFLFDLKHIDTDKHKELFGIGNERVKMNLQRLVELNANIVVRMPLIKGYNDAPQAVEKAIQYVMSLAEKGNIRRIDILPYHAFGKSKYARLDRIYSVDKNTSYTASEMDELASFITQFDFDIRLVQH